MPSCCMYSRRRVLSVSARTARPPSRWQAARSWSSIVLFPQSSGPLISTNRPRGKPDPTSRSIAMLPHGT